MKGLLSTQPLMTTTGGGTVSSCLFSGIERLCLRQLSLVFLQVAATIFQKAMEADELAGDAMLAETDQVTNIETGR
jgi:hypothetical protein